MHYHILNTRVDCTSYRDACDRIQYWAQSGRSCYVVAANVHVVMSGWWDRRYQQVINQAALVTSDGMPLVLALRWLGNKAQSRVYGPDLMLAWCDRAAKTGLPIYLYGSTDETLTKMRASLEQRFPGLVIAGMRAPAFREMSEVEERADRQAIQDSGAKVVFVGLGCPKQELWMARQAGQLDCVMVGVGAAFQFFSGEVSQAPRWMMGLSLEWLYRLCMEPRRLWKRYLVNNPAFVLLFLAQWLGAKIWPQKVERPENLDYIGK
jgi:N-acetylglucosaminyldiphosphoundecaprenol N-acetyl-beta-D-mannosaminyltransferase